MSSPRVRHAAILVSAVAAMSMVAPVPINAAPAAAADCAVQLYVSDSADRGVARPLAQASLRRNTFVFVDAPGAVGRDQSESSSPVETVRFSLRPAGSSGGSVSTELVAPFDLRGTDVRGAAVPLVTNDMADVSWVLSVTWSYKAGRCAGAARSANAAFTVDNSGPAPYGECWLQAYVATRPDRTDARPLADAVVRGAVYLFIAHAGASNRDLYPASTILASVRFSLDAADGTIGSAPFPGPPVTHTERVAPFDFAGGHGDRSGLGDPLADPWDSTTYPVGEYTLASTFEFVDDSIFGCGDDNHGNNAAFTVVR